MQHFKIRLYYQKPVTYDDINYSNCMPLRKNHMQFGVVFAIDQENTIVILQQSE